MPVVRPAGPASQLTVIRPVPPPSAARPAMVNGLPACRAVDGPGASQSRPSPVDAGSRTAGFQSDI